MCWSVTSSRRTVTVPPALAASQRAARATASPSALPLQPRPQPLCLLPGPGPDPFTVDPGAATPVHHDLAAHDHPLGPHAGREGQVPGVGPVGRPRHLVAPDLG